VTDIALALHHDNEADNARTVMRNILQFVELDDSNNTAWVRMPDTYRWYWWNNDIEANARVELRDIYTCVPLKNGDTVASGDKIEVVLKLTAKNSYDYLAFEDMKPAGCEPMELRSGGRWAGGLCANLELRDEKVVFFIGLLEQGQHVLRYKLRAETPGHFHALPAKGFAMYAPELKAISDEMRLRIKE
jgi:uncharacterized protein YfaS (alpha-2-macroglobulin family)